MRLTKKNNDKYVYDDIYCGKHIDKLGQLEDIEDKYNIKSIDELDKKLKALEIIKEKPIIALVDYTYTYEEWLELVDEKDKDLFKNKEEYDLLKEELL